MSMKLDELYIEIKAKTDTFETELKAIRDRVEGIGKNTESTTSKLSQWGNIATGIKSGYTMVLDTFNQLNQAIGESVKKAAELEVLRSVFQGSTEDINLFKQATANTVSEASLIKLSNQASDMGISLKDQAVFFSLAEDAADKYGGSTEENFQKVVAASEGSSKAVKALGIQKAVYNQILTDLAKATGIELKDMDAESQKILRLEALRKASGLTLEDVKNKTMDSADQLESFGVAMDELGTTIGKKLLPVILPVVNFLKDLVNGFTKATSAQDESVTSAMKQSEQFKILSNTYLELRDKQNLTEADTRLYKDTVKQLTDKYPELLKNVNLEKDSYDKVKSAIMGAREELDKYVQSKLADAMLTNKMKDLEKTYAEIGELNARKQDTQLKIDEAKKNGTYNKPFTTKDENGMEINTGYTIGEALTERLKFDTQRLKTATDNFNSQITEVRNSAKNAADALNASSLAKDDKNKRDKKDVFNPTNVNPKEVKNDAYEIERKNLDDINKLRAEKYDEYLELIKYKDEDGWNEYFSNKTDQLQREYLTLVANGMKEEQAQAITNASIQKMWDDKEKYYEEVEKKKQDAALKSVQLQKDIEKQIYDYKIQNYLLSVNEYEKYLEEMLQLELKELDKRNREIEKANKDNNTDNPTVDLSGYAKSKRSENKKKTGQYGKDKNGFDAEEWSKQNKMMAEFVQSIVDMTDNMASQWGNAMAMMIVQGQSFGETMKNLWSSLASYIISEISRILAKAALLAGIKAIFSGATGGIGGFIMSAFGLHDGGTVENGKKIASFAAGGNFIVPQGYPNDSYPMLVESGERVTVTPTGAVGQQEKLLGELIGSVRALNKNFMMKNMSVNVEANVDGLTFVKRTTKPAENKLIRNGYKLESL